MEKKTRLHWRFIFALSFLCLYDLVSAQQDAVILGKTDDGGAPVITFSYKNNPFTLETIYYDAIIDSASGVFALRVRLKQPVVVFAHYKEAIFKIYLTGGDTIRMRFNGERPAETVVFEGEGAAQNTCLTRSAAQDKDWTDEANVLDSLQNYSAVDYEQYIERRYQLKKNFFLQYPAPEKAKFTASFSAYIYADVEYWRAYSLMLYYQKFGLNNTDPKRRIPADYFDFLKQINPVKTEALNNDCYLRFLDQWLLYREEKETGSLPPMETALIQRKNKIVRYATASIPLQMAKTPQTPEDATGFLNAGEKTEFLNVRTAEMYPYKYNKATYYDQFYKIKTDAGVVGWVPFFGVGFSEETITETVTQDRVCFDSLSPACGFERFIPKDKKTLYFLLAKNLLLPFATASEQEMDEAVQRFSQYKTPYPEYESVLKETARLTLEGRDAGKSHLIIPDFCSMELFELNPVWTEALFKTQARAFGGSGQSPPLNDVGLQTQNQAFDPAATLVSKQPANFQGLKMNDPAPAFAAKDANGHEIALADFAGKVIYLDFWASWCGPCKEHIKYTQRLFNEKYKGKNAVFIYCSIDKNETDWKLFLKENNLSGISCRDGDGGAVQEKYSVKRLPTYFLIDKAGKIQLNSILQGEVSLENALDALLQ